MDLEVHYDQYTARTLRFLIDTGADINLIRTGLTEPRHLTMVKNPLQITTANRAIMPGGEKQVNCTILMKGVDIDTKEEQAYHLPIKFYEADIGVEGILCYNWLATYDLVIRPFKNCLQKVDTRTKACVIFVGLRTTPVEVSSVTRWDTPFVTATKPTRPGKKKDRKDGIPRTPRFRRMMDLFSGTGSVGKVFRDMGYEVITVNVDGKTELSIVADKTIWKCWKAFRPRYFEMVAF